MMQTKLETSIEWIKWYDEVKAQNILHVSLHNVVVTMLFEFDILALITSYLFTHSIDLSNFFWIIF